MFDFLLAVITKPGHDRIGRSNTPLRLPAALFLFCGMANAASPHFVRKPQKRAVTSIQPPYSG